MPSSGAAEGFKGDVKFSDGRRDYLAEVKVRKGKYFQRIYNLFAATAKDGVSSLSFGGDTGVVCVVIATTAKKVFDSSVVYPPAKPEMQKGVKQLLQVQEFVKECDILVIKQDHHQPLFIRYR